MGEYLGTHCAHWRARGVTHISAYALIVEEGTPLHARVQRGEDTCPRTDDRGRRYAGGGRIDLLEGLSYANVMRYRISPARAFSVADTTWAIGGRSTYLGLGVSAAEPVALPSCREGGCGRRRWARRRRGGRTRTCAESNTPDVRAYTEALLGGLTPPRERMPVTRRDAMLESVMPGLRTVEGVKLADFAAMHGKVLDAVYRGAIETLRKQGLLDEAAFADGRLALNRRGLLIQNTALMPFLDEQPDR